MGHRGSNRHLLAGQPLVGVQHIKGTRCKARQYPLRWLQEGGERGESLCACQAEYKSLRYPACSQVPRRHSRKHTLSFARYRRMAFGLDLTGGTGVSEMNTFYSGHYWPAACLDMNDKDDYAQDSGRGEWLSTFISLFITIVTTDRVPCELYTSVLKCV